MHLAVQDGKITLEQIDKPGFGCILNKDQASPLFAFRPKHHKRAPCLDLIDTKYRIFKLYHKSRHPMKGVRAILHGKRR